MNPALIDLFQAFRENPSEQFRVRLRRIRCGQLQRLLADPSSIDLDTFNKEVWVFETRTLLGQRDIKGSLFGEDDIPEDLLATVDQALADGTLELHGNYIWGSATAVYGAQLPADAPREQTLREGLGVLNDPSFSPIEKVNWLMDLPGFGRNISTGLAMVYHPSEFAIYNKASQEVMTRLGYSPSDLASFQSQIREMRETLEADDFLELDWFLYQFNRGVYTLPADDSRFWWVNQGKTYEAERANGYIFASLESDSGQKYQHHTNVARLHTGDTVFHYARGFIHSISQVTQPAVEVPRPVHLDGETPGRIGSLAKTEYLDLVTPISLDEIPKDWRTDCPGGPFDYRGQVRQGYLYPLPEAFAAQMSLKFADRIEQSNIWLFQANPRYFDVAEDLRKRNVGDETDWGMSTYYRQVQVGDRVLIWQSGELAGLYALAEIIREPYERQRPDWRNPQDPAEMEWAVDLKYTRILDNPIPRSAWLANSVLSQAEIIKVPNGTNFRIKPAEWAVVKRILDGEPVPARRVVKIAPGDGARLWEDCRRNGYICVGWDDVGDLTGFASKEEFRAAFEDHYGSLYNQHQPKISTKANELWSLRELRAGDLVFANKGISEILAVGTVQDIAYQWRPERTEFKHTVNVEWDTSKSMTIPPQGSWRVLTVAAVSADLQRIVLDGIAPPSVVIRPQPGTTVVERRSSYIEPSWVAVLTAIGAKGFQMDARTLRRYHVALKTRGFVILSGVSGTGKTWLTEAYAQAVGAEYRLVPVAPNWTTNEDLLGYFNPLDRLYNDTPFSRFLRDAAAEYQSAMTDSRQPKPFHLALDEMNLARIEYYFARFLSAMEVRMRTPEKAAIELSPGEHILLPPNLRFIGTVNMDETTHGFSDKVYDRAQLIELPISRNALEAHMAGVPYRDVVLEVWDAVAPVAPFAFRVADEIRAYVCLAESVDALWEEALDEQFLHKVLPKVKGADPKVGPALEKLVALSEARFPLTYAKAEAMLGSFRLHGFADYFTT